MYPVEDDVFKPIPWVAGNKLQVHQDEKDISKISKSFKSVAQSVISQRLQGNVFATERKESLNSRFVWDDSIDTTSTECISTTPLKNTGHTLDDIFPLPSVPRVLEELVSDTVSFKVETQVRYKMDYFHTRHYLASQLRLRSNLVR